MKRYLIAFVAVLACISAQAQPDCPQLQNPVKKPEYAGGLDSLQKYFDANPLTDDAAQNIAFRVHIQFAVHCSGGRSAFQITSKGEGELKRLAEQVLEIAKKMPGKWSLPEDANGVKGDGTVTLSFTVVKGKIKVFYK